MMRTIKHYTVAYPAGLVTEVINNEYKKSVVPNSHMELARKRFERPSGLVTYGDIYRKKMEDRKNGNQN